VIREDLGLLKDIISFKNQYYIKITSPQLGMVKHVLKHGETFAIFDRFGDIQPGGDGGVYHEGTRFLSRLNFTFGSFQPLFLSSGIKEDNAFLTVDLTNPDITAKDVVVVPKGSLHVFRSKFLYNGVCYEHLRIRNYGLYSVDVPFSVHFGSDFADVFEVRGVKRRKRGKQLNPLIQKRKIVFPYRGADGRLRKTIIRFSREPNRISNSKADFHVRLQPKEETSLLMTVACELDKTLPVIPYENAARKVRSTLRSMKARGCEIYTSNEQFNDWLNRSLADIHIMLTKTSYGFYPYGGIPWFNTAFGRDGIITSLELLWVDPYIAKGVLLYLAANQASHDIPNEDAEPGKILHEIRKGEMARIGEVPFRRYYGSVDSTPLFVFLAGEYYRHTGDKNLIKKIWPNIEMALRWMDEYGDHDGDGFVEYIRRSPKGLLHQGWKDSSDSIFYEDGATAEGPIALCEVQGYVYAAKSRASELTRMLGDVGKARSLARQAAGLKEKFQKKFWSDDISTYVLALDGKKRPCKVRTSNAAHSLFSGIASSKHARRISSLLMDDIFFSGWGVRTVATSEVRYNPTSYHNGSIWPHDNALVAFGLGRYGYKDLALKILTSFFDASLFLENHRLPELFCGFERRRGEGPTLYPGACVPQSWAAAAPFLMLQACMGLSVVGEQAKVIFDHPVLPEFLQKIRLKNLKVGNGAVDVLLTRQKKDVELNVIRKRGNVDIMVMK